MRIQKLTESLQRVAYMLDRKGKLHTGVKDSHLGYIHPRILVPGNEDVEELARILIDSIDDFTSKAKKCQYLIVKKIKSLPKRFSVLARSYPFRRLEKIAEIRKAGKSAGSGYLGHRHIGIPKLVLCERKTARLDITADGGSRVFSEQLAKIVFIGKYRGADLFKCQLLGDVTVDIFNGFLNFHLFLMK